MEAPLVALSANKGQMQKCRLLLFFLFQLGERIKTNAMAKGWSTFNVFNSTFPITLLNYQYNIFSQRVSQVFCKKGVLRKFAKFLGKTPVPESLFK